MQRVDCMAYGTSEGVIGSGGGGGRLIKVGCADMAVVVIGRESLLRRSSIAGNAKQVQLVKRSNCR